MGAKPVFKRYKDFVYLACCSVISLFLFGCQHPVQVQNGSTLIDKNQKKYLTTSQELILNNDFKGAADENRRILKYYSRLPDTDDMVSSNYLQNAGIIAELLTRIMADEKQKQSLLMKIESNEKQIKILTLSLGSFKRKADALEKKLADMDLLTHRVKTLEKEKETLQQQIHQLKKIDLNPNPVGSKQPTAGFMPANSNN